MQNKRYKLLKWYPSLSTSWEVGMEIGQGDRVGLCANFSPCNIKYPQWQISYDQVVNFPEFWKEIKEVKLEVPIGTEFVVAMCASPVYKVEKLEENVVTISARSKNYYTYDIETFNDRFTSGTWTIYKEKEFEVLEYEGTCCMCDGTCPTRRDDCKIYKVKRLSDGETFSIGDKVYYLDSKCVGDNWIIDNFYIRNDGVLLVRSKDNIVVETISTIKHSAKPLFLDELGNEVFEGDKYYFVTKEWSLLTNNNARKAGKSGEHTDRYIYFKNKVDAENYINENKPMFSKKQIKDALEWGYLHSIVATEMYRAVKIKLDL